MRDVHECLFSRKSRNAFDILNVKLHANRNKSHENSSNNYYYLKTLKVNRNFNNKQNYKHIY